MIGINYLLEITIYITPAVFMNVNFTVSFLFADIYHFISTLLNYQVEINISLSNLGFSDRENLYIYFIHINGM